MIASDHMREILSARELLAYWVGVEPVTYADAMSVAHTIGQVAGLAFCLADMAVDPTAWDDARERLEVSARED